MTIGFNCDIIFHLKDLLFKALISICLESRTCMHPPIASQTLYPIFPTPATRATPATRPTPQPDLPFCVFFKRIRFVYKTYTISVCQKESHGLSNRAVCRAHTCETPNCLHSVLNIAYLVVYLHSTRTVSG